MNDNYSKCMSFFLAEGLIFSILGILMLALPKITTYTTALIISALLVAGGLYKLINSIILRHQLNNAYLSITVSILMITAGIYLLLHPMFNILMLTIILASYFLLEGISSSVLAVQNRYVIKYWWISFIAAIIQFLLAAIIIASLPFSALLTIGLLLGIDFVFSGIAMIALSSTCKYVLPRN